MAADICATALAEVGGHYSINQTSLGHPQQQQIHHPPGNMYKIHTQQSGAAGAATATTTTYTIDITTACANCGVAFFDSAGNEVVQRIFYMAIDKTNEAILISSALQVVLAVKLAKCSEALPKVALCAKCGEIVAQMYHLYKELDELSNVNSFINSFVINDLLLLRQPESSDPTGGAAGGNYHEIQNHAGAGYNLSIPQQQQQQHYKPKEEPKSHAHSQDPMSVGNYYSFQYPVEDALLLSEISSLPPTNNALIKQETDASGNPMMYSSIAPVVTTPAAPIPAPTTTPKKSAKRKKKQPPPLPPPPPPVPEKPKRIIHCPEPGCNKTYTGAGARRSLRNHAKTVHHKLIEQESHGPSIIIPCSVCQRPLNSKAAVREHEKTHLGTAEKALLEQQQAKDKESGTPVHGHGGGGHGKNKSPGAHGHSTTTTPTTIPIVHHHPQSSSATSFTVTVTDPSPIAYSITTTPTAHGHGHAGTTTSNGGTSVQFPCSECGKTFTNKTSLNIHFNRQHKNPKSFNCSFDGCGKTFRDKSSVRRHELSHEFTSGTKPEDRRFSCKSCDKAFKLKHHLQSHLTFSHKYSPEEARAEVYPGLEVKDWMTKPRKKVVRKKTGGGGGASGAGGSAGVGVGDTSSSSDNNNPNNSLHSVPTTPLQQTHTQTVVTTIITPTQQLGSGPPPLTQVVHVDTNNVKIENLGNYTS